MSVGETRPSPARRCSSRRRKTCTCSICRPKLNSRRFHLCLHRLRSGLQSSSRRDAPTVFSPCWRYRTAGSSRKARRPAEAAHKAIHQSCISADEGNGSDSSRRARFITETQPGTKLWASNVRNGSRSLCQSPPRPKNARPVSCNSRSTMVRLEYTRTGVPAETLVSVARIKAICLPILRGSQTSS